MPSGVRLLAPSRFGEYDSSPSLVISIKVRAFFARRSMSRIREFTLGACRARTFCSGIVQ